MNNVYSGPLGQGPIAPEVFAAGEVRVREKQYRKTIEILVNRLHALDEYLDKYSIGKKTSEMRDIIHGRGHHA